MERQRAQEYAEEEHSMFLHDENTRRSEAREDSRQYPERRYEEWECKKSNANNEWECESKRGNAVSMSPNGAVRFTKFDCRTEVKVDGKVQKGKCGVELS